MIAHTFYAAYHPPDNTSIALLSCRGTFPFLFLCHDHCCIVALLACSHPPSASLDKRARSGRSYNLFLFSLYLGIACHIYLCHRDIDEIGYARAPVHNDEDCLHHHGDVV